MQALNNNLPIYEFKTFKNPYEWYLLFFILNAERYAITHHFRKSYFSFILSFLGLTREESKTILKQLIRSGFVIPKRRFGYAINLLKVKNLVESADDFILQNMRVKNSKQELREIFQFKEFLEGEQNE